jgi:hypothetical protein
VWSVGTHSLLATQPMQGLMNFQTGHFNAALCLQGRACQLRLTVHAPSAHPPSRAAAPGRHQMRLPLRLRRLRLLGCQAWQQYQQLQARTSAAGC